MTRPYVITSTRQMRSGMWEVSVTILETSKRIVVTVPQAVMETGGFGPSIDAAIDHLRPDPPPAR